MDYIKLIGGLILLVISGDYLVRGGVAIATRLKISALVIGMTVVAFGTSAPEFLVSLQAAMKGNSEIAIGNVVGSNIANIGLILGITALIYPLTIARNSIRIDWPVMMAVTLLFTICASFGSITRWEGITGFILLLLFTFWQIRNSRKEHRGEDEEPIEKNAPLWLALLYIGGSAAGLAYGADFLIEGASNIAKSFGVSERVIGVTIVAFGTSLPELAASVSAALKRQTDIAFGNVLGSNIFNILCVVGLTSLIKPIPVEWLSFRYDFICMILFSLALFLLLIPVSERVFGRNKTESLQLKGLFSYGRLGRLGGFTLLVCYIYYIYTLF